MLIMAGEHQMSAQPTTGTDVITASEIGDYLYCQRAWWYALDAAPALSAPALRRGTLAHRRIGHRLSSAERATGRGRVLLLAGLLVLTLVLALVVLHLL